MNNAHILSVEESEYGMRLDIFVASRISECSRSLAAALIRKGNVRVGGKEKKPGYRVQAGEHIRAVIPPPEIIAFEPEEIPLAVLYEDTDIAVIDKPPGLVVHPAPGHYSGTLVNALLHHCPDIAGIGGEMRPGIVHRLDQDTSGLLVIAKNAHAMAGLSGQFHQRTVKKKYMTIVHGQVKADSGIITLPVGRHPADRKKMSVISRKGKPAETRWQAKERFAGMSLLEIDLKTGRTHQIRVHCAAIRHPVVGDPLYGSRAGKIPDAKKLLTSVRRQMLHAKELSFVHPGSGRELHFASPLPEDMNRLLSALRERI
ncbi:MAG: RluA family pseudouridine synthase [Desulfococcaceae bacterium]|jgi:23S rRNA pseudouridine1911/1915/1917 synthase|nr:RluA family pseudouridine synthase [Desulfococcaceae bacterium]